MRLLALLLVALFLAMSTAKAVDAYLAAGVAAMDREWAAADFRGFIELVTAGKVPLPRLADPAGAKVLKRFCSSENLALGGNKSLPLQARMQEFMVMQTATTALAKLYIAEASKRSRVGDEMTLVVGSTLRMSVLGLDLVDEFYLASPRDASYEVRMEGLKKMKSGLASVFAGAYVSVGEDSPYSDQNRSDLLVSIAKTAPRFATWLSADMKTEMTFKYTKLQEKLKGAGDRESIAAILKELKG